jgi:carbon-monoxide dehydrogenase medium subunit
LEYSFKDLQWGKELPIKEYLQPTTLKETLEILSLHKGKARIIAGGTDIIPYLRKRDFEIETLVDITSLPGMSSIDADESEICLGGLVTHAQVSSSSLIKERAWILAEGARRVGSPQIRNIATVAGNLVSGQPAADTAIPLLALDAKVKIVSEEGEREVPLTRFFLEQGRTAIDSCREIISEIRFSALRDCEGASHLRLSKRKALSLPILVFAGVVTVDKDRNVIIKAKIALGPVAPVPFRAARTEAILQGATIDKRTLEMAIETAIQECCPRESCLRGSRSYRNEMIKVFLKRGLRTALAQTGFSIF